MSSLGSIGGLLGGSTIGAAIVKLELDTAKYQAELRTAQAQTGTATTGMGNTMAQFGGLAKAGLATAGIAVVAFGVNAIKAASDVGEAVNKNNVIFGDNAKAVEAWAEEGATAFGLSKAAALDAVSGFGAMLQTAGMAVDESAKMSQSLVQLAGDMASFNNIDPTEALEKLRSGLAGEAEPLRRFGVFLSEAAVQQEAYRSGIAKTGEELTEAQKVQARYNIIFEQTTKQQGDFSRTADSLPNQIRTITAEFTNLSAEIGEELLPVAIELLGVLRDIVDLAKSLGGPVRDTRSAFEELGGEFGEFGPVAQDAIGRTFGLGGVFRELDMAVLGVAGNLGVTAGEVKEVTRTVTDADGTVHTFVDTLISGEDGAFRLSKSVELTAKEVRKLGRDTKETGRDVRQFANMTGEELEEWSVDVKESFDEFVLGLEESAEQTNITRREFLDATRVMQREARQLATAMKEISKEKWVNDEYIAFLSEQGPEWLIGFSNLTESEQRRAQRAWEESTNKTDAAKRSLDRITGALEDMGRGKTQHTIEITYKYVGFDPTKPGMGGPQP